MTLVHLRPLTNPELYGEAFADEQVRLDHREFRTAVGIAARRLAGLGIGRGDVVAVVLGNRVELVVAMYAAWQLGAALTPVNPALTEDEVSYQLADAGARLAIVDASSRALVTGVAVLDVEQVLATSPAGAAESAERRRAGRRPGPVDLHQRHHLMQAGGAKIRACLAQSRTNN